MKTFPEDYPKRLQSISWTVGEIAGPFPYFTSYLPHDSKSCGLFVKDVLLDIFYKNGCPPEICNNFCNFFVKAFTVYFNSDEGCFKVSLKKKTVNDKKEVAMKPEDFKKAFTEFHLSVKEGKELVKHLIEQLIDFYNKMIKR